MALPYLYRQNAITNMLLWRHWSWLRWGYSGPTQTDWNITIWTTMYIGSCKVHSLITVIVTSCIRYIIKLISLTRMSILHCIWTTGSIMINNKKPNYISKWWFIKTYLGCRDVKHRNSDGMVKKLSLGDTTYLHEQGHVLTLTVVNINCIWPNQILVMRKLTLKIIYIL